MYDTRIDGDILYQHELKEYPFSLGCSGNVALFYCDTPLAFHINILLIFLKVQVYNDQEPHTFINAIGCLH